MVGIIPCVGDNLKSPLTVVRGVIIYCAKASSPTSTV